VPDSRFSRMSPDYVARKDYERMTDYVTSQSTVFPGRRDSWRMFDRIVRRYDLLNRVLSFRLDQLWRRQVARMLPDRPGLRVLDLATGTGDMLFAIQDEKPGVGHMMGMDMSAKMLSRGREKLRERPLHHAVQLVRSDATSIAAADGFFDAVTMAFGIRNVEQMFTALQETRRVLRPGGRLLILEFSIPRGPFCQVYLFYLRHVMTRIGGYVSGDAAAYEYLNRTIESFPCSETFCGLMREAGFHKVRACPQTLGIATIYSGER